MSAPETFLNEVARILDDYYTTTLMDKIDDAARRHGVRDDEVTRLLSSPRLSLDLEEAWLEYVE